MADYIDRKALLDALWPIGPENDGSDRCTVVTQNLILSSTDIEAIVSEIPAADVREDVHGEWKPTEYPIMPECEDCSVCGYRAIYGHNYKFCPHCGARMDGDGNG